MNSANRKREAMTMISRKTKKRLKTRNSTCPLCQRSRVRLYRRLGSFFRPGEMLCQACAERSQGSKLRIGKWTVGVFGAAVFEGRNPREPWGWTSIRSADFRVWKKLGA